MKSFPAYLCERQPLFTTCFPHTSSSPPLRTVLSPLYLSPPLLFSLSHTHSPGLLHSHSSPSNLYLGAMLVAPTHSHQALQCIPIGCRAYRSLAFACTQMHAQTHIHTHTHPHRSQQHTNTHLFQTEYSSPKVSKV